MFEHKKNDYCKIMCQFSLIFVGEQHSEYITARFFDNRTRLWWKENLNDVISGFIIIGHNFDYVGERNVFNIVDKRDRTYEFYIKHKMHAVEWK